MSIGVETIIAPDQDDIILANGKVYANYGCPDETIIGATRGGSFNVKRTIKAIDFDGALGKVKGFVRKTEIIPSLKINFLSLRYLNKKEISYINSADAVAWASKDWDDTGGTYTAETTLFQHDDRSAKITASVTKHGIHKTFATAIDLTEFDNLETSTVADYICFAIYITTAEIAKLSPAILRFVLPCDVFGTLTNYYHYDVDHEDLVDGWNVFKVAKTAFTEVGTGDWSAITGVALHTEGTPTAEYDAYIDNVFLLHNITKSANVPVSGGAFDLTQETTYRKILERANIENGDYLENVAWIGNTQGGKAVKIIINNALSDENLSNEIAKQNEFVSEVTYTGHYLKGSMDIVPYELYIAI